MRLCAAWQVVLVTMGDGAPSRKSSQSDGEFYAWLVHPEHVFEANLMQLRVRLFPNTNEFPGMRKADVNRFDDTVVQATIALEDISVPLWNTQIANRPQSHLQREKARGREALEFCRRAILNASGLLVVAPRYAKDSDRLVHCRLELLDEAGRSGGSWRAAREEWVWVAEGFGLGAADASIVVSHLEGVGIYRIFRILRNRMNRGTTNKPLPQEIHSIQKNRGYKPLPQEIQPL